MDELQVIDGVTLSMQLGTALYALRLNRLFGTDRAGWALFGAFSLLTAMHLTQVWSAPPGAPNYQLEPNLLYLIVSVLILTGLTHVGVLFRERLRTEKIILQNRDELEDRVQERTQELHQLNASLEIEIKERKKLEMESRASEKRYEELVASVDGIVFEAEGEDLRFTFVSPQCQRLLGFPPERWLSAMTWRDLVHPEDSEMVLEACRQSLKAQTHCGLEFRAIAADGREVFLRQFSTVVVEGGRSPKFRGVLVDVTEQRTMELQLRQAQKLESIGRLAGGVAHDFNNLLTVVQGHAAYLLGNENLESSVAESLKQIHVATERAAHLTSQLLAFGRRQTMRMELIDLNEVVASVGQMLRRILGEDIALQCQYCSSAALIKGDSGMIEQVLMNLAVNARDAMPNGGELNISTAVVRIQEDYLADGVRFAAGSYACLKVKDTGSGIAPSVLPRIFEPFFTTKDVGKGTGLGLAMAYGIARQHQGWITVASAVNAGATFEVYLPTVPPPPPEKDSLVQPEPRGGHETVLVVEDEAPVRALVCSILKRYGYRVCEADSPLTARQVWKEHLGEIDLLLTDIVMPGGMNGWELADALRQDAPGLAVVCMSGYNPELLRAGTADHFVAKPFQSRQLAEAIRLAIDSKADHVPVSTP